MKTLLIMLLCLSTGCAHFRYATTPTPDQANAQAASNIGLILLAGAGVGALIMIAHNTEKDEKKDAPAPEDASLSPATRLTFRQVETERGH